MDSQLAKSKKDSDVESERKGLTILETSEKLEKVEKQAEKLRERIKASSRPELPKTEKEEQWQEEIERREILLKCSTCKIAYRSVVLTKCMHSKRPFLL